MPTRKIKSQNEPVFFAFLSMINRVRMCVLICRLDLLALYMRCWPKPLCNRDFIREFWWEQDYQNGHNFWILCNRNMMCQLDKSEISAEDLAMQNSGEEAWSLTLLCLTSLKLFIGEGSFLLALKLKPKTSFLALSQHEMC